MRKLARQAMFRYHTDRFPNINNLPEEEKGRIMVRAKLAGAIANVFLEKDTGAFSIGDYLAG